MAKATKPQDSRASERNVETPTKTEAVALKPISVKTEVETPTKTEAVALKPISVETEVETPTKTEAVALKPISVVTEKQNAGFEYDGKQYLFVGGTYIANGVSYSREDLLLPDNIGIIEAMIKAGSYFIQEQL